MNHKEKVIKVDKLNKTYGSTIALKDVSLELQAEGIYGLLGRNGAGKTTLLDIISSRIFADSGDVTCFERNIIKDPSVISEKFCYMPETETFPPKLKVKKILEMAAGSFPEYDTEYEYRLCKLFNLEENKKYEALSKGNQSILRLVLGLASGAPVTIFDEPVSGLDAVARDRFYSELMAEFGRKPRLFIISTHLIEESANLFNEAIIIKDGEIISQASVEELLSNVFYVSGSSKKVDEFLRERNVLGSRSINNQKTAVVEGNIETEMPQIGMRFSPLSIQKLFIYLTGPDNEEEVII